MGQSCNQGGICERFNVLSTFVTLYLTEMNFAIYHMWVMFLTSCISFGAIVILLRCSAARFVFFHHFNKKMFCCMLERQYGCRRISQIHFKILGNFPYKSCEWQLSQQKHHGLRTLKVPDLSQCQITTFQCLCPLGVQGGPCDAMPCSLPLSCLFLGNLFS